MTDSIRSIYDTLDRKPYVRIVVFLLPGILLGSIASRFDLPDVVRTASSVLLLAGCALFAGWRFIHARMEESLEQEDAEVEEGVSGGAEGLQPASMADLVAICGNDQGRAMLAMMVEREIFPHFSTDECIAMAVYRKQVEARLSALATPPQAP